LLQRGVDKASIFGLPDFEILIEIKESELARIGLTLNDISRVVAGSSIDVPAGRFADGALRVRSLGLRKTASEYEDIKILVRADGSAVTLGDVATIKDTFSTPADLYEHDNNPAIVILVQRGKTSDSLKTNAIVQNYIAKSGPLYRMD
jgi:multidrug efflux pump subunit AcrB